MSTPKGGSTESVQQTDNQMDALLAKTKDASSLLPDELSYLVSAFVPSQSQALRSKAYLTLSAFCQGVRASKPSEKIKGDGDGADAGTLALSRVFQPLITSNLSETQEDALLAGITFLSALFQVDWQSASQIFQEDGFIELLATLELSSSPTISLELARLYAQASSHKVCRSLFPDESITWLRTKSSQGAGGALRAVAVIALLKLSRGSAVDAAAVVSAGASSTSSVEPHDEAYAASLKDLITSHEEAVEGLAYLSDNPSVKQMLANTAFLKQLFSLVPKPKATAHAPNNSTLLYGVLIIVANLCAYKPRLNQEEQQIAKLRRMAEAKQAGRKDIGESPNPLDSDTQVQTRCRTAIGSGVLDVLATTAGIESQGTRTVVGKIFLSLVEDKGNRGKVLQGGGAKTLTRVIKSFPLSSTDSSPAEILPVIQALAKLAITASPIQVFGPNEGNSLDAIRPLSHMLLHSSSNMLQQFEAIMALTNIASHPACAARIADTPHLLNKVELLMLEDHLLIRRASVELICNLIIGSESVVERYGGGEGGFSKSKIQVLLAMSDVEDLPTRLAASGALAMLTSAPSACQAIFALQVERHRAFLILAQLIDPSVHIGDTDAKDGGADINPVDGDAGLVHRGVACFHNILGNLQDLIPPATLAEEIEKAGLVKVFEKLLKGELGSVDKDGVLPLAVGVGQILSTISKR
ncbi:hypothetical protein HYDPIDRAFT_109223 [Hydnomerulius pinastri MD-312]|nr:hypothetical protein HYDPIDRAFT_109223 [Hydnomerulius pinastri MD-312]